MQLINVKYLLASLGYSLLGVAILVVCFVLIDWLAPEKLWMEILKKQNKALAIMAAAFMIALAIIISSAIHG
jgi:uncharacterized membrane protein YjfL (UPF0719 family)